MAKPPTGRLSLALAVFLAELTGAPILEAGHGSEVKKRLHEQRKKSGPPVAGTAVLPTQQDPVHSVGSDDTAQPEAVEATSLEPPTS